MGWSTFWPLTTSHQPDRQEMRELRAALYERCVDLGFISTPPTGTMPWTFPPVIGDEVWDRIGSFRSLIATGPIVFPGSYGGWGIYYGMIGISDYMGGDTTHNSTGGNWFDDDLNTYLGSDSVGEPSSIAGINSWPPRALCPNERNIFRSVLPGAPSTWRLNGTAVYGDNEPVDLPLDIAVPNDLRLILNAMNTLCPIDNNMAILGVARGDTSAGGEAITSSFAAARTTAWSEDNGIPEIDIPALFDFMDPDFWGGLILGDVGKANSSGVCGMRSSGCLLSAPLSLGWDVTDVLKATLRIVTYPSPYPLSGLSMVVTVTVNGTAVGSFTDDFTGGNRELVIDASHLNLSGSNTFAFSIPTPTDPTMWDGTNTVSGPNGPVSYFVRGWQQSAPPQFQLFLKKKYEYHA